MINYALIGEMLLHPTAQRILAVMAQAETMTVSPKQLADEMSEPIGNISYHVGTLAGARASSPFHDSPLLELVDTEPRRGAVEHFYRLTRRAVASS